MWYPADNIYFDISCICASSHYIYFSCILCKNEKVARLNLSFYKNNMFSTDILVRLKNSEGGYSWGTNLILDDLIFWVNLDDCS